MLTRRDFMKRLGLSAVAAAVASVVTVENKPAKGAEAEPVLQAYKDIEAAGGVSAQYFWQSDTTAMIGRATGPWNTAARLHAAKQEGLPSVWLDNFPLGGHR